MIMANLSKRKKKKDYSFALIIHIHKDLNKPILAKEKSVETNKIPAVAFVF